MLLALLGLAAFSETSLAGEYPEYYRVHGVASNDTLSVRGGPSTKARKLGDLAPDASPVEAVDSREGWVRITSVFAGSERMDESEEAWVSARYLKPVAVPHTGDADAAKAGSLPVGLECIGAWPPWSLAIGSRLSLTFGNEIEGEVDYDIVEAQGQFAQRPPVIKAQNGQGKSLVGIFRPVTGDCAVGMEGGNHGFSYQADVVVLPGSDGNPFHGCCFRPLDR